MSHHNALPPTRGMTFASAEVTTRTLRHAITPVNTFRNEAQQTIEAFQDEVKELHEMIQYENENQPTKPSTATQTNIAIRSTVHQSRPLDITDLDSDTSLTHVATLDIVESIEMNRQQRRHQLAKQQEEQQRPSYRIIERNKPIKRSAHTSRSEQVTASTFKYDRRTPSPPSTRIASSSQQISRRIHPIDRPTQRSSTILNSRKERPEEKEEDDTPPSSSNRRPWEQEAELIPSHSQKSSYLITRPPPMLTTSDASSELRSFQSGDVNPMGHSSTKALSSSASASSKKHKWQLLYAKAEDQGWSIRPDHATPASENDDLTPSGSSSSRRFWPLMTAPPKRIPYELAQQQQASSRNKSFPIRSRPQSPPANSPLKRSVACSPVRWDDSTPMPPRPSSAKRLQQPTEAELEQLRLRHYEPLAAATQPPTSVTSSSSHSPTPSIQAALTAQREEFARQLAAERQAWLEEKNLIWQHYQTDIATLMKSKSESKENSNETINPSPPKTPPAAATSPKPVLLPQSSPLRLDFQPLPSFPDSPSKDSRDSIDSHESMQQQEWTFQVARKARTVIDLDRSTNSNSFHVQTLASGHQHPFQPLTLTASFLHSSTAAPSSFSSSSSTSPTYLTRSMTDIDADVSRLEETLRSRRLLLTRPQEPTKRR